jgi:O-antigen ligase
MGSVSKEIGGRLGIWRDTLRIIADYPWTGTGMNTFGFASLVYQSATPLSEHYKEAHNEYLQVAAEGGLLVGVPVLLCVWSLSGLVVDRLNDANRLRYWLRAGAVTSLLAIAVQSLVEFSLQMPANAALAAVVMAIAVHKGRDTADVPAPDEGPAPGSRRNGVGRSRRHR